jgi:hypothetical protein
MKEGEMNEKGRNGTRFYLHQRMKKRRDPPKKNHESKKLFSVLQN